MRNKLNKEEFDKQKKLHKEKMQKMQKHLEENQIRFEDCKEDYTYKVDARNFDVAIFHNGVFHGIRHKFMFVFLDEEIHWDKDDNHGTVRPLQEIEKTPNDVIHDLEVGGEDAQLVMDYLVKVKMPE